MLSLELHRKPETAAATPSVLAQLGRLEELEQLADAVDQGGEGMASRVLTSTKKPKEAKKTRATAAGKAKKAKKKEKKAAVIQAVDMEVSDAESVGSKGKGKKKARKRGRPKTKADARARESATLALDCDEEEAAKPRRAGSKKSRRKRQPKHVEIKPECLVWGEEVGPAGPASVDAAVLDSLMYGLPAGQLKRVTHKIRSTAKAINTKWGRIRRTIEGSLKGAEADQPSVGWIVELMEQQLTGSERPTGASRLAQGEELVAALAHLNEEDVPKTRLAKLLLLGSKAQSKEIGAALKLAGEVQAVLPLSLYQKLVLQLESYNDGNRAGLLPGLIKILGAHSWLVVPKLANLWDLKLSKQDIQRLESGHKKLNAARQQLAYWLELGRANSLLQRYPLSAPFSIEELAEDTRARDLEEGEQPQQGPAHLALSDLVESSLPLLGLELPTEPVSTRMQAQLAGFVKVHVDLRDPWGGSEHFSWLRDGSGKPVLGQGLVLDSSDCSTLENIEEEEGEDAKAEMLADWECDGGQQHLPGEDAPASSNRESREVLNSQLRTVFLDNLPESIQREDIEDALAACGAVADIRLYTPVDAAGKTKSDDDSNSKEEASASASEGGGAKKGQKKKAGRRRFLIKSAQQTREQNQLAQSFTHAFVSFQDEGGYMRALSAPLRVFGVCIQGRMCKTSPACDMTSLYIKNTWCLPGNDLAHKVRELLTDSGGGQFSDVGYLATHDIQVTNDPNFDELFGRGVEDGFATPTLPAMIKLCMHYNHDFALLVDEMLRSRGIQTAWVPFKQKRKRRLRKDRIDWGACVRDPPY
ncbi:unnamed protein product [Chrysoparadoxa australica]